MVIEAIQNLTQLFARSSAFTAVNAERQATDQLRLTPGQQVQAEILANLPNQRFLARIAGELFRIELPMIVQPGETLQMTFVTGEPHPVFTLSRSGNSATPVSISDTGKLLGELLLNTADREQIVSLARSGSLLAGPPVDTAIFAGMLRDALTLNGVFYESHLLQWFLGRRSLVDISKEPQGKLRGRAKSAKAGKLSSRRRETDGKIMQEETEDAITDEMILGDGEEATSAWVDPRAIPLIREQLHTLHSGQVAWQGEVWPRQMMEWSVGEEKQAAGEGKERSWQSTLRLELPSLGEVAVTMRLEKEGLSLWIRTGREETSGIMREERQVLEQAMARAGLKMLKLAIDHEEDGK